VLALVVALGGVAYSSIPDPMGVIHGCYENSGRTLRVIDTGAGQSCGAAETALNWSQRGPAGPTSAQGPQGAQGPPGQPPAFTKSVAKVTVQADVGFAEVARLDVPAGRYVVFAKALALASGSQSFGLTIGGCWLRVGAAGLNGKLVVEQASDFSSASLVTRRRRGLQRRHADDDGGQRVRPSGDARQAGSDLAALLAGRRPVAGRRLPPHPHRGHPRRRAARPDLRQSRRAEGDEAQGAGGQEEGLASSARSSAS
jgi:hypothetical protein